MPLTLIEHGARPANAAKPSGQTRGVAQAIGVGIVRAPAHPVPPLGASPPIGRVESAGTWASEAAHETLGSLLGPALAPSLRRRLEWYRCRGAFFHNDAHFSDVLFGVWCVGGSPVELVFPRAEVRIDASPGRVVVFDPFEVHGVLAPGRRDYVPEDYTDRAPSIFIGFELSLTREVARIFRVPDSSDGPTLSSRTRIAASTGALG